VCETLEELVPLTSRAVTKLWASRCENDCWGSCYVGNLLLERVARQVVAGSVAPYALPPSVKALFELLGESPLVELLGKLVAP
jgi:hypothetical protein